MKKNDIPKEYIKYLLEEQKHLIQEIQTLLATFHTHYEEYSLHDLIRDIRMKNTFWFLDRKEMLSTCRREYENYFDLSNLTQ